MDACLAQLSPGPWVQIGAWDPDPDLGIRLSDLGLIPGTRVRCRYRNSNLTALEFRGAVMALRIEDLKKIGVIPL